MVARHGTAERVYRMEFVSNQEFSDGEFDKWKQTMIMSSCQLPNMDDIRRKEKELAAASEYRPKDDEIDVVRRLHRLQT